MPKYKSVCRVCGKPYEACSSKQIGTSYRWQEVSCSPECGMIYLEQIMQSRNPKLVEAEIKPVEIVDSFPEPTIEIEETPLFDQEEIEEESSVELEKLNEEEFE